MSLQSRKNFPDRKVQKGDISVAKNHLKKSEIKSLEKIISMYLDFAESQATSKIPINLQDCIKRLDAFLQVNGYDVLKDFGSGLILLH